jgi:hypothetical protein
MAFSDCVHERKVQVGKTWNRGHWPSLRRASKLVQAKRCHHDAQRLPRTSFFVVHPVSAHTRHVKARQAPGQERVRSHIRMATGLVDGSPRPYPRVHQGPLSPPPVTRPRPHLSPKTAIPSRTGPPGGFGGGGPKCVLVPRGPARHESLLVRGVEDGVRLFKLSRPLSPTMGATGGE